jgi:hypothetical protein
MYISPNSDYQSGSVVLVRRSKVQISRVALYWAVLTAGFAFAWTLILNALQLAGVGPALSLVVPVVAGGVASILLYALHDHQALDYDDNGYTVEKGRKSIEHHKWSEFNECSIVKDSYGRNKARAYFERDGSHLDIDTSACGIDPYAFRDYMADRIRPLGVSYRSPFSVDVFSGLEKEVQRGRAAWIADLNETFKDYQISGEMFRVIARGGTRPKGFLLSRFVAMTIMPDYRVCLYANELKDSGSAAKSQVMRLIRLIETQRDQRDIKWSWLLLFSEQEPPELVNRFVEDFGNKDIGIGCIDVGTGKVVTSRNQLGRSLTNQMRLNKLMKDLKKRKRGRNDM